MAPERRHRAPGRRETDHVISIWRELDVLRDRLEHDVDDLEEQLRAFGTNRRAAVLASWTKTSIAFGVIGVVYGVLEGTGVL